MRKITHIVLHTAAAERNGKPVDPSAETIRAHHLAKGWSDIGYHYVIRFDGTVEAGRPLEKAGAHVQDFNLYTVGICFSGHGDLADFTAAQKKSGHQLVFGLLDHFNLLESFLKNPQRVLGHRECYEHPGVRNTGKSCPGRKVSCGEFRKAVLAQVSKSFAPPNADN